MHFYLCTLSVSVVEYTLFCTAVVLPSYLCVVLAVPPRATVSELTLFIRCLPAYYVDSPTPSVSVVEYTRFCTAVVRPSYLCVVLALSPPATVSELTLCIRCLPAYYVDSPTYNVAEKAQKFVMSRTEEVAPIIRTLSVSSKSTT
ncbi:hypothetical protein CRM22_010503 [Opisthorchis felineus]|uniref:Uncharacterized protein n=1 Tax=Opisthorchis felineus TaxID=147828 RepID=A0A4S2KXM7_OPIFE|nr:hypothetical protein CRM22_010503 [Opisthorchis felineus]